MEDLCFVRQFKSHRKLILQKIFQGDTQMMTKILTLTMCLTLSTAAFAKHGRDDRRDDDRSSSSRGDSIKRGSQAWFAYETAEKEIRVLLADNKITQDSPTEVNVRIQTPATSLITLKTADSQITDSCRMEDHSSRSGTIIKKEVYCNNAPYYSPEVRPAPGSNAWALHEAIEHSLRLEVANNAAALEGVTGVSSQILANSVKAVITLKGNVEKTYLCNNQAGRSLSCFLQ